METEMRLPLRVCLEWDGDGCSATLIRRWVKLCKQAPKLLLCRVRPHDRVDSGLLPNVGRREERE